ncbi:MAG: IclR family transcriptional regulator [Faecalibacterium sp.]
MNRTVQRTIEMLNYIGNNPKGVSLKEIAEDMDMPKSSAFVILQSLIELNCVTPNLENEKKYHIGVELFSIGMKYASEVSVMKETSAILAPLAEKYNKTGFVAILDGVDVVYMQKYKSSGAMLASCALGSRKAAHSTALGKAILAFLSPSAQADVLSRITYEKLTEDTIADEETLCAELTKILQTGYALDVRENNTLLSCCAAPIFNYSGTVIAAISLSDVYKAEENIAQLATDLKETAMEISRKLGYIENKIG